MTGNKIGEAATLKQVTYGFAYKQFSYEDVRDYLIEWNKSKFTKAVIANGAVIQFDPEQTDLWKKYYEEFGVEYDV